VVKNAEKSGAAAIDHGRFGYARVSTRGSDPGGATGRAHGENGVQPPSDQDIRGWCRACSAEQQIPDLIAAARAVESAYLEFRRQARAGMRRVLGAHTTARYERTSVFRIYEHNVIPGLFQTAAYSAAMLSFWTGFLDVPNDIEAAVASRMERQREPPAGGDVDADGLARHHPADDRKDRRLLGRILDLRPLPGCAGNTHCKRRGHPAALTASGSWWRGSERTFLSR